MALITQVYSTEMGRAYKGDALELLADTSLIHDGSVNLLFTSPPFALTTKKEYGNAGKREYFLWLEQFLPGIERVLADNGSLVVDIGGSWEKGYPVRSTYHFELAVFLASRFDFCQEFYWYNPAKLPCPAEWVNRRRIRVKDSVNLVLWLAKDASNTKADNRRVLKRYSDSMDRLLKNGYQVGRRPSNHRVANFMRDNDGAIPPNLLGFGQPECGEGLEGPTFESLFTSLLAISNTGSTDRYLAACREHGLKAHPARAPIGLPAFFIEFLTDPGDLVCDPFAGSNTTGAAAEQLGRRWVTTDVDTDQGDAGGYVRSSAFRFANATLQPGFEKTPRGEWRPTSQRVGPLDPSILLVSGVEGE